MSKIKITVLVVILLFLMFIITSCTSSKNTGSTGSGDKAILDDKRAVEKAVSAGQGGEINLDTAEGDKVRIVFPQGSLAKDASLVAAPLASAPLVDNNLLINGFSLEEKGVGKGPALRFPALIIFTAKGALPEGATIVKYRKDGKGYDIIPTKVKTKGGKSTLIAQVTGFSKYGVARNSQKSGQESAIPQKFNWVIYINDKASYTFNSMRSTVNLKIKAVNKSGDIEGIYTGTANARTDNEMEVNGAKVIKTDNTKDDNLNFNVSLKADLEPLVKTEPELAPLVSPPDFIGRGNLNMTSDDRGTMTVGGYTVGAKFSKQTATPMEIEITGPLVRIKLPGPSGPLYFNGFIRGEGK